MHGDLDASKHDRNHLVLMQLRVPMGILIKDLKTLFTPRLKSGTALRRTASSGWRRAWKRRTPSSCGWTSGCAWTRSTTRVSPLLLISCFPSLMIGKACSSTCHTLKGVLFAHTRPFILGSFWRLTCGALWSVSFNLSTWFRWYLVTVPNNDS